MQLAADIDDNDSSSDEDYSCDDSTSIEQFSSTIASNSKSPKVADIKWTTSSKGNKENYKDNDYVIVLYEGDGLHYTGQIIKMKEKIVTIKCMVRYDQF